MQPHAHFVAPDGARLTDVIITGDDVVVCYDSGRTVLLEGQLSASDLGLCHVADMEGRGDHLAILDMDGMRGAAESVLAARHGHDGLDDLLARHRPRMEAMIEQGRLMAGLADMGIRIVPFLHRVPDVVREIIAGVSHDRLDDLALDDRGLETIQDLALSARAVPTSPEHMLQMIDRVVDAGDHFVVTQEDDGGLRSHTIGLVERGWPELVVTGLSPEQGQVLLDAIVHAYQVFGVQPVPGSTIMVDGIDMTFGIRPVANPDTAASMALARARRSGRPLTALQVTWPDGYGILPGEEGWSGHGRQPLL